MKIRKKVLEKTDRKPSCRHGGGYASQREAMEAVLIMKLVPPLEVYCCEGCGDWHIECFR